MTYNIVFFWRYMRFSMVSNIFNGGALARCENVKQRRCLMLKMLSCDSVLFYVMACCDYRVRHCALCDGMLRLPRAALYSYVMACCAYRVRHCTLCDGMLRLTRAALYSMWWHAAPNACGIVLYVMACCAKRVRHCTLCDGMLRLTRAALYFMWWHVAPNACGIVLYVMACCA